MNVGFFVKRFPAVTARLRPGQTAYVAVRGQWWRVRCTGTGAYDFTFVREEG